MKAIPHHSRKLANFMILAQNISWFRIKRKLIFPWNILWIETWVFRYGKFWWSVDIPHSTIEGHALQAKGFFFKNRRYRDAEERLWTMFLTKSVIRVLRLLSFNYIFTRHSAYLNFFFIMYGTYNLHFSLSVSLPIKFRGLCLMFVYSNMFLPLPRPL